MAAGDIREQSGCLQRLKEALALSGATLDEIVKLNLFFASDGDDIGDGTTTMAVWSEMAPSAKPAMTPVRAGCSSRSTYPSGLHRHDGDLVSLRQES